MRCVHSLSRVAVYCPAGYYIGEGETCEPCPRHTFKVKLDYYAEECTPCPDGTPGTFDTNSTSEDECHYGSFSSLVEFRLSIACTKVIVLDPPVISQ